MPTLASTPSLVRHDSPRGWWEMVSAEIDPRLRGHVVSWCGFREWTAGLSRRREVPSGIVPLIIDFGSAYRVAGAHAPEAWARHRYGFGAGMHDGYALTESVGLATCMQVNFTPIGAHLCFGLPMSELTNRVIDLDDLFGAVAGRLVERLHDARDWGARFDLLADFLANRLAAARPSSPGVAWAWQRLTRARGQLDIASLAADLRCSRKHLIALFREQIGVPPKTMARILRFEHAVGLFQADPAATGTDVAVTCGYFDQAHFIKDFRQFAGLTPREFLRHRLPDLGGIAAD